MSCAASFESSATVLLFPQGPASLHFYGRVVLLPSRALVTLFAAQQREQNDCVFLAGEGDTVYDVGLLSEGGGEECVVEGVMASGGSLARLSTAGWGGGGGGGPAGGGGPGGGPGGGGAPEPPALAFEPSALAEGAPAAAAAAKYFPEVAGLGEPLVVFGALKAAHCAWRPAFALAAGSGGQAPPADTIASLLARFS